MSAQDQSNIIKQVAVVILVTLFFMLSCTSNSIPNGQAVSKEKTTEEIDSQFLVKAADINLAEIKYGQLAQQKGSTLDIIKLGKMIETEHLKFYSALSLLADNKSVTIPIFASESAQNIFKQMSEKDGNSFDSTYSETVVNDHKSAIEIYKTAYNETNDEALKAWIKLSLVGMNMHLQMASISIKKYGITE